MNSNRIAKQAYEFNIFDKIFQYTENDISDFINKHVDFINSHIPGYGYYIWKPKIILDTLDKINHNDILIYCDAGMYLNKNGIKRFHEYIDKLNNEDIDIVTFSSNGPKAKSFIKMDAIMEYYPEFNKENNYTNDAYSGVIIIKKTNKSINLIKDWLNLCEHYNFLDTNHSTKFNEASYFIGNNKDQALFNLCLAKHKISYDFHPDEINIYRPDGRQFHHTNPYLKKIDVNNADWSSLDDKPFQARRITPKFNYDKNIY
jgi:hypothetical protein